MTRPREVDAKLTRRAPGPPNAQSPLGAARGSLAVRGKRIVAPPERGLCLESAARAAPTGQRPRESSLTDRAVLSTRSRTKVQPDPRIQRGPTTRAPTPNAPRVPRSRSALASAPVGRPAAAGRPRSDANGSGRRARRALRYGSVARVDLRTLCLAAAVCLAATAGRATTHLLQPVGKNNLRVKPTFRGPDPPLSPKHNSRLRPIHTV